MYLSLVEIEDDIQHLSREVDEFYFYVERKQPSLRLESSRQNILLQKEETLRQKSKAIWIKVGDDN